MPRVMFELGPEQLVKALEQPSVVVDLIVAEIKTQGLDGVVSWFGWWLLHNKGGTGKGMCFIFWRSRVVRVTRGYFHR